MNKKINHFIHGKKIYNKGKNIKVFNPSNGKIINSLNCASDDIIEQTIVSSLNAFNEWKEYSIAKRTEILFEYKVLLEKNKEKLAKIIGEDLGKVYDDALGEVRRGIENIEYACGIGEVIKGEYNKNISTDIDSWSEFSPIRYSFRYNTIQFPSYGPDVDVSLGSCNWQFIYSQTFRKRSIRFNFYC